MKQKLQQFRSTMKFVFTSYISSPEFNHPEEWLERIKAYIGILEELAKQHEVISIERINYEGNVSKNGVHYRFINFGGRKILFPWRMHNFIKEQQPDVVIIHGLHFPLQVLQLRRLLGRKVIIIAQHHAEKPASGIRKYFQQAADRCIDAYLFASKEMGIEWVRSGNLANANKIHEIMEASSVFHPVDKYDARSKTLAKGNPVFLWVGRLDHNKDPLTVINAFMEFIQHRPEARLYMIYHTVELLSDIKKLLVKKNVYKDAVILVGKVPHYEMLHWFNSADFIISGSHYEGSGIAICEGMSCACIPILTDIPSFRKMTGHGKCGILYKAGNRDDLLQALIQTNRINFDEERRKVLQQFHEELSFEAIVKRIQEVVIYCNRTIS